MRAKGISFQQVILGAALLAALCWNLAHASEINNLRVSAGATGTRAEIGLDSQVDYKLLSLSNPDRLVLDLPGAQLPRDFKLPVAAGLVKDVRTGHPEPGITRIVFDLHASVVALKPRFEAGPDGTRLVVEWPGDNGGDPIARIAAATTAKPAANPPATATSATGPGATPAPAASTPPPDPAIASAAATSRLIAATTLPDRPATVPASPQPAPQAQAPQQVATASAAPASGTVATGVPTR